MGPLYVDALNMLLLTLRGIPTTYYGDELGMEDIQVSYAATQDPYGKNYGPVSSGTRPANVVLFSCKDRYNSSDVCVHNCVVLLHRPG